MRLAKPQLEPELRTARLVLRPIRESDLDDLVAEINDFGVAGMLGRVPYPYDRRDAERYLVVARENAVRGRSLYFAIERDGRLIGGIGIGAIPYIREFGYWLGRAHWGKGFATEAGRAVLGYAFEALGMPLVRSGVFVDNHGSRRVQWKLGFRRIGIGPKHCLARGSKVDHIDTVLTRARFLAANT